MAKPKTQNCSRVIFLYAFLFLLTSLKFQTPLTLRSHSSGLKNYSNKNYHIFRKPWASAFRWHTLDTSEKSNLREKIFSVGSIERKFFPLAPLCDSAIMLMHHVVRQYHPTAEIFSLTLKAIFWCH